MKFSLSPLTCEISHGRKNHGCRSVFVLILWVTQDIIYVALGVSIDRPSATNTKAIMTLLPAETCSKLVVRNNVHVIDMTEKLARIFIHKT
jgi:hypothetical protein